MLGEVSVHDGLDIIGAVGDDTVNAVFEHLDNILFLVNRPCVDLNAGGMGAADERFCRKRPYADAVRHSRFSARGAEAGRTIF